MAAWGRNAGVMGDHYRTMGHNLDFEECLSAFGTDGFAERVIERLRELETELPLHQICQMGGDPDWEDWTEYDFGEPTEQGNKIILEGDVWFNESIPTGCRDHNFREPRHGTVLLEIDKDTGRADFTVERAERYNAENY